MSRVEPVEPGHHGRAARGYAATIVFLRFLVPVVWVVAAAVVYQRGPTIEKLPMADVGALLPEGLPSQRAEERSASMFGTSVLPRIAIVQRRADGLSPAEQRAIVEHAALLDRGSLPGYPDGAVAVPYVNTLRSFPAARERGTTAITYLAFPAETKVTDQRDLAVRYADEVSLPGATARVTGFVAGNLEQSQSIEDHLRLVELATILVVAAIIGLYLRSLLAPLVTLAAAGLAWVLATRAVSWMALKAGMALEQEVEPIVAVLLLGVVTDYSVFFLSGSRFRLLEGADRRSAARGTTATYIPIVLMAGLLVAAGLTTLRVGSIGFVQALGPAMAVVVLVSMLVSVTFVPAAIAIFGRALFWPGLRHPRLGLGLRARRLVTRALTWRVVALLATVALGTGLVVAARGLGDMRLALSPIQGLPAGAPARAASDEAAKGFAAGIVSPTELVVRRPGLAADPGRQAALGRLLDAVPGVAAVVGPGEIPLRRVRPLFLSQEHDAVRYLLVLDHHPFGAAAVDDLRRVESAMPSLLGRAGLEGAQLAYAGDTAIAADTVDEIRHDIAWVTLAAFLVNFVLLALFLRALVAPLLLILASALGLAATFGITVLFFQGVLGEDQLTYYVPLAVGVLLLSFGSDYNLFVVGRIWQESRSRRVSDAIRVAAPRASRAISVAGAALALSFAALAIVPLAPFREFAFAMAVGVLLDTFVVRTYLIPALIALFGRLSWWPGRRGGSVPAAPEPAEAAATRS